MAGTENGTNSAEKPQPNALDRQIQAHQDADNNRSWIGYVASQVWRGDRATLTELQQTADQVHQAQQHGETDKATSLMRDADRKIEADKKAVDTQNDIAFYTSSGLKMAALMTGVGKFALSARGLLGLEEAGTLGSIGMASTVGLYAVDNVKVGYQGADIGKGLLLGSAQGLVTKSLFNGIGSAVVKDPLLGKTMSEVGSTALSTEGMTSLASRTLASAPGKGMLLGATSRGTELAFDSNTYHDQSGKLDLATAAAKLVGGTFDPRAMALDGAMFGLTHSFANAVTGGAAARPFYHTLLTSGTLGISGGSYSEIQKEWASGQSLDWGEIARRGLLQGAVYTIAGVPGGLAADAAFRRQPVQTVKEDLSRGATAFKNEATDLKNQVAESLMPPPGTFGGLRPAYAMAMESTTPSWAKETSLRPEVSSEPLRMSMSEIDPPQSHADSRTISAKPGTDVGAELSKVLKQLGRAGELTSEEAEHLQALWQEHRSLNPVIRAAREINNNVVGKFEKLREDATRGETSSQHDQTPPAVVESVQKPTIAAESESITTPRVIHLDQSANEQAARVADTKAAEPEAARIAADIAGRSDLPKSTNTSTVEQLKANIASSDGWASLYSFDGRIAPVKVEDYVNSKGDRHYLKIAGSDNPVPHDRIAFQSRIEPDPDPVITSVHRETIPGRSDGSTSPLKTEAAAGEWLGTKYDRQEDAHFANSRVAMVADGIGGSPDGDLASAAVKDSFERHSQDYPREGSMYELKQWLEGAIKDADHTVATNHPQSGATVASLAYHPESGEAVVAWAGDSRVYKYSNGKLEQLTVDDTPFGAPGNVIDNAIGMGSRLNIHSKIVSAEPGARFLVATDGHELLPTAEISRILSGTATAEQANEALLRGVVGADKWGGKDNTSIIVFDVGDASTRAAAIAKDAIKPIDSQVASSPQPAEPSADQVPIRGKDPIVLEASAFPSEFLKPGDIAGSIIVSDGRLVDPWTEMRREAEQKVPAEELPARKQEVEKALTAIPNERPVLKQMEDWYQYFADHPEMDSHIADLYVKNYDNLGMRRLIDGFYNTPRALERDPSLAQDDVKLRFNIAVRRIEEAGTDPQLALDLKKSIALTEKQTGADLTPAIEQYARLQRNQRLAFIVDLALADSAGNYTSNYSGILQYFGPRMRSLSFTPEQMAILKSDSFVQGSADGSLGPIGQAMHDALAAKAAGQARDGALGDHAGLAGPDQPDSDAARQPASPAEFAMVQRIQRMVDDLDSPQADVREKAMKGLSRPETMSRLDDTQFDAWYKRMSDSLDDGTRFLLQSQEIQTLPKELLKETLAGDWSALTRTMNFEQAIDEKLSKLQRVQQLYGDSPESVAALVHLSKNDPLGLAEVLKNTTDKKGAIDKTFKEHAVKELATAESLEGLSGATGLARARLYTHVPEIADKLLQMSAADPDFKLDVLADKLAFPKNTEAVRQTLLDMFADGKPTPTTAQLNVDYVMAMSSGERLFYGYPESSKAFLDMAKTADPQQVVDILKEPYDRPVQKGRPGARIENPDADFNKAYKNLMAELVLRGADVEQLSAVANALKKTSVNAADGSRRALDPDAAVKAAQAAVGNIIPKGDPPNAQYLQAARFAKGIIARGDSGKEMVRDLIGRDKKPGILAAPFVAEAEAPRAEPRRPAEPTRPAELTRPAEPAAQPDDAARNREVVPNAGDAAPIEATPTQDDADAAAGNAASRPGARVEPEKLPDADREDESTPRPDEIRGEHRYVGPSFDPNEPTTLQKIATAMGDLDSPSPEARQQAVTALSRPHMLDHMSDQQFDAWFKRMGESLDDSTRYLLELPEVKSMPKELVRELVSADWANLMKGKSFDSVMEEKLSKLQRISQLYGDSPEAMAALVHLGKNDPVGLKQVLENTTDQKGGIDRTFKQQAVNELPTAESLRPLAGPEGLTRARLNATVPEIADKLMAMAAADPTLKLDGLAEKMVFPKNADQVRKTVRDMFADGKPEPTVAQLNPDYIMALAQGDRMFYGYPEASKAFLKMAESADPKSVVDLLKEPYDRPQAKGRFDRNAKPENPDGDFNKAYKNLLAELVMRGANVEQLSAVANALKKVSVTEAGPRRGMDPESASKAAQAAISEIIPKGDPPDPIYLKAARIAKGIIVKGDSGKEMIKDIVGRDKKPGVLAAVAAPKAPAPEPAPNPAEPESDASSADPSRPAVNSDAVDLDADAARGAAPEQAKQSAADRAEQERLQREEAQRKADELAAQAKREQEERLAALGPEQLAELVDLQETLGARGDDAAVKSISQELAADPIAGSQLEKVMRQSRTQTLPDGTQYATFPSKGAAEKFWDKAYGKLTRAVGASESESDPFGQPDGKGRYVPMVQLGMPDGRQFIVTPTFDKSGNIVGLSKIADEQMIEAVKAARAAAATAKPAADDKRATADDQRPAGETERTYTEQIEDLMKTAAITQVGNTSTLGFPTAEAANQYIAVRNIEIAEALGVKPEQIQTEIQQVDVGGQQFSVPVVKTSSEAGETRSLLGVSAEGVVDRLDPLETASELPVAAPEQAEPMKFEDFLQMLDHDFATGGSAKVEADVRTAMELVEPSEYADKFQELQDINDKGAMALFHSPEAAQTFGDALKSRLEDVLGSPGSVSYETSSYAAGDEQNYITVFHVNGADGARFSGTPLVDANNRIAGLGRFFDPPAEKTAEKIAAPEAQVEPAPIVEAKAEEQQPVVQKASWEKYLTSADRTDSVSTERQGDRTYYEYPEGDLIQFKGPGGKEDGIRVFQTLKGADVAAVWPDGMRVTFNKQAKSLQGELPAGGKFVTDLAQQQTVIEPEGNTAAPPQGTAVTFNMSDYTLTFTLPDGTRVVRTADGGERTETPADQASLAASVQDLAQKWGAKSK